MQILRQSTSVVISFGPFVDRVDGISLETGLVSAIDHVTTGIKLSKNGGALTVRHASVTASTYDSYGCYLVTLDTTDSDTLGHLRVIFVDPNNCLPVWRDFTVVTPNVYDSMCSTDYLEVDVINWKGATAPTMGGDTYDLLTSADSELSAVPTTAGSIINKIRFLFQYFRNKRTVSASTETMYKEDASTTLGTSALSDDGATFTHDEIG